MAQVAASKSHKVVDDELLDSHRLAELLSSTPGSIRKAHQRGLIPQGTTVPGLGLRWRRSEIQAWIEQRFARP